MADETYRKFHAGRYPATEGGPGEASYAEGSKTGYYKMDESGLPIKKSVEESVDLTATKALRKLLGGSDTGERGVPAATRKRMKEAGE